VNTNIGNSGNLQMAMGMAMSGRLFDLVNFEQFVQIIYIKIFGNNVKIN
jgi:hypothetical protein